MSLAPFSFDLTRWWRLPTSVVDARLGRVLTTGALECLDGGRVKAISRQLSWCLLTSMPSKSRSVTANESRSYRVLMIAPTSFFADYGCHVRILEEARVLQKLGHRVTIVAYHSGNPVPGLDIRRTLTIPWRKDYEVGSSRHKIAFDALLGLKVFELLARERFDVVHAHLHEGALIGLVLGRLFGRPVVFDFQGSMTGEMLDHHFLKRQGQFYKLLRRLEEWIDRHSSLVLTSTIQAEQLLTEEFGCRPEHIRSLPDCVDTDTFRRAAWYDPYDLAELRRKLGVPAARKVIVYLGLLAEYQGTGHLLEALQRVVRERQDVHLLLMGFPNLDFYRQEAEGLGISDFVTFTGRVPYQQAPMYLALGDVAVAPKLSLTEGAGKLLNYMAVGLPTVAFDTPVAREYLGSEGLLAVRGDVEDLARNLLGSLSLAETDPETFRSMGQRLRQRAVQHFSWDRAGKQIVTAYQQLLGEGPQQLVSVQSGSAPGR
jgi:glycosyltransferase involved in cell wall biosynthesis